MVVAPFLALVVMANEQPVSAGTYSVSQCDEELGITTSSFVWQAYGAPGPIQHANTGCLEFGLAARTSGIGTSRVYPAGAHGGYSVAAPAGTTFTRFSGFFGTLVNCCVAGMDIYAGADELADGSGNQAEIFRGSLGASTWQAPAGSLGPVRIGWTANDSGFTAQRIGYRLVCAGAAGCAQTTTGDVRVRGRSFEFTLDDYVDPEVTSVGGSLLAEGWVRGTRNLTIAADDEGGGLVGLSASMGGESLVTAPSNCSQIADRYVDLRPCPLARSGTWPVDTRSLEDGSNTIHVQADDVGGAADDEGVLVKIDNTPPSIPAEVFLDGSQQWRSNNGFSVRWEDYSEQHAPITRTHYEACRLPDGECAVGAEDGEGGRVVQIDAPAPGTYGVRIWLEDAAGNVGLASSSVGTVLKFDDGVPGRAHVAAPPGWLNSAQAENVSIGFGLEPDGNEPLSGIAGYSVSIDGSQPDETIEVAGQAPNFNPDPLPEGVTPVAARAISSSGVAASTAGSALIKIDRSPPTVRAEGLPDSGRWHRQDVLGQIVSVDQPALSGVDPAPLGRPVAEGAYLTDRLDGSLKETRGERASVPITTDGHHTLTYRAFDAAGNGSVQKEVEFKIDGTAPVGSFRALDPRDPRQLRVDVADATSGVEDGRIEYRREGESGFERLATTRGEGILSARLEDQGLPAGRYELRAVVTDVAGNEAVIDTWAGGAAATLGMPLRSEARVTVVRDIPTAKRCGKAASARRGKGKRRQATARRKCRRESLSKMPPELGYGKRAGSTGRLTTGQGAPIADAPVIVEGRARSGAAFVPLGTARTDGQGKFRFKIPAGPSRTVRYRYDGTNTIKPAVAQLVTKVRAAARLKASRRRLRNGQAVRFSGRLPGRPIPSAGKLVALQAKVGRRWRTFATPRANAKGVFRHRYRFTATTGVRRYAFRALVAREAAYPYERGLSPTLTVTVRGRDRAR